MFIIYDLIFLIVVIIYFPVYLFRRKFHRGFISRLGILPKDLKLGRPIWIHAVSVGEVMAVRGLIGELTKNYPDNKIVISTVTSTGNKIAKGSARECDFVTYLPLDFSFIVRMVVGKIRPALFIIAETEIWPNLISCLYSKNIPIAVVNGRISDSSFRGYLMIKFLLKPILNRISLFCMQTERDAQRLIRLGVSGNKINVTGNMKFDARDYTDERIADYTDERMELGLKDKEKLLVAGSTHPGEEEIVLGVYKKLLAEFTYLRLLIAPRDPERAKEVEGIVIKYGFLVQRVSRLAGERVSGFAGLPVSRLNRHTGTPAHRQTVFILDTVGHLVDYYAVSDLVFVGGSLIRKGGHNILEPASLGKPILFGPHMFNFRDIAELFLENQAAQSVRNRDELAQKLRDLLNDSSKALQFSRRAKGLIRENQGATQKNLGLIKNLYAKISL